MQGTVSFCYLIRKEILAIDNGPLESKRTPLIAHPSLILRNAMYPIGSSQLLKQTEV